MGVTISFKLSQEKRYVKGTLDEAQRVAGVLKEKQASVVGVNFEIRRVGDFWLGIDIGECETLAFDFKSVADIEKKDGGNWSYEWAVLTEDGKQKLDEGYEIEKYPQNEIWYAAGFCKTQFADKLIEHKWVAEILRVVAGRCKTTEINDEGDYYHSGNIGDAAEAIEENGKMISNIGGQLRKAGWKDDNIISGETKIKAIRKKRTPKVEL